MYRHNNIYGYICSMMIDDILKFIGYFGISCQSVNHQTLFGHLLGSPHLKPTEANPRFPKQQGQCTQQPPQAMPFPHCSVWSGRLTSFRKAAAV